VAATNAVRGPTMTLAEAASPIGSFTDPEYAQVGLTEAQARAAHDVVVSTIHFDATTRTIIDGRTFGFCKLIVDRATHMILGCHVVGERAVEITQVAAIAITAGMRVDELAHVPLSFPTYAGILGRAKIHFRRADRFPASGMMFANPKLVVLQLVYPGREFEVSLELEGRVFTNGVVRSEKDAKAESL
jgi:hypothetical protein